MKPRKTRYSHYNLNYHFVWIPKYRRKVLVGKIAAHLLAQKYAIEILDYSIHPDHVHLFVSAPPRFSPASLVNLFKGFTGRKLREAFPDLMKHHSKKLWTRTYYVGTAGTVSAETIQNYIQQQEGDK